MFLTLNKLIKRLSLKQLLPQTSYEWRHFSSNNSNENDSESENIWEIQRDFKDLSIETFRSLATEKTIENKIEKILSEYEYEKYSSLKVPTNITIDQMKDLLSLKDSFERKNWINYLFKRELARIKSLEDRKQHKEEYWTKKKEEYHQRGVLDGPRTGVFNEQGQIVYGLWHNTLFSKILKNSLNRYFSHRLRTAALFGPKLVIDLDFDKYMKLRESRMLAEQIKLLYNWNRYRSKDPFDLHFTNCDPNGETLKAIHKLLQNSKTSNFLADFHQKSYLDLFPKKNLVYLSPNATEVMKEFNYDDIYIIGGFIDKSCREPVTFVKAQKEGIRCVRLPLDEYLVWGVGNKNLCLNHILQILHDVNVFGDWGKALRDNIPKRKQKTVEQIQYEDELRKQKLKRFNKSLKFDPSIANNYF